MAKKTLILSQKQLDEICGGDSNYLDGLALNPDLPLDFANQVTTNGSVEQGYADPMTTDDFADEFKHNRRNFCLRGRAMGSTVREMTKRDWEIKIVFNEDNQRLLRRNFGATNDSEGKGYYATKKNIERYDDASEKSKNASTPEERQKALETMRTMERNWPGLEVAKNQYETAKKIDKQIRPNIKSAPKESGNGKAHSIKKPVDGVFLN